MAALPGGRRAVWPHGQKLNGASGVLSRQSALVIPEASGRFLSPPFSPLLILVVPLPRLNGRLPSVCGAWPLSPVYGAADVLHPFPLEAVA